MIPSQMRVNCVFLAAVVLGAVGCDGGGGYLITPVSADRSLQEAVVQKDPGWVFNKVALLDVSGLIANDRGSPLFGEGENPVTLLSEKLRLAAGDAAVKAVVLRINSPGGTVQASETMYTMLMRFRQQTGKPVIACITDVGASGGYYLACAGNTILCQPTSITGSIGVIIQTVSFAGTMKMIGVTADAITSGSLKDMGSPLKDLPAKDRALFQAMVDDFYGRFLDVVARGRPKLDREKLKALADGRVYTGAQALELGLVDKLGDLQDALALAKSAAGIGSAKVVMYHRPLGYRSTAYSSAPAPGPQTQFNLVNVNASELMCLGRPAFLYLWSTDPRIQTGSGPWR